ncbi:hypothetical protein IQ274_22040 [Nostoc sp. LEGE 12447]|uniref:hypothetical protein n=1 Tax=Nostoc sp. LEGE 12447 TaxID=1828640 RepID=UPI00188400CA|nr:hypothetical protein [Nostoc sp. LEGE 12447]MBE9000852.1 hypothetical protein [Nostoc sp. LEGE 12447]
MRKPFAATRIQSTTARIQSTAAQIQSTAARIQSTIARIQLTTARIKSTTAQIKSTTPQLQYKNLANLLLLNTKAMALLTPRANATTGNSSSFFCYVCFREYARSRNHEVGYVCIT